MTRSILVIEDEPGVLRGLCEVIESHGYLVTGVENGRDVVARAQCVRPDLCVVDMMLPGESGIEIAAALREEGFADTPMIGITGSPFLHELAEEVSLFQAIFAKPIDFDEFMLCIAEMLEE